MYIICIYLYILCILYFIQVHMEKKPRQRERRLVPVSHLCPSSREVDIGRQRIGASYRGTSNRELPVCVA